ncbi:MAG: deoxyribodipyrimidine photolyase, partial [Fimbriiglobus sp.]
MSTFNDARVRPANDHPVDKAGKYVVYWPQMSRRLRVNHGLDYALHWSRQLKVPLVIYEGLKLDYPWATARSHRLLLDGMRETTVEAARLGVNYWPFVETPENRGRGLVRRVAAGACLVVTDDYPQFIVPAQIRAMARAVDVAVHAVDGNGMGPLALLGPPTGAAAHLRPKQHKLFADAWKHRAEAEPDFPVFAR